MKRFLKFLAAFSVIETIGRHPIAIGGSITLLGVGGVTTGVIPLNPPSVSPQPSAMFTQSNELGNINAGLVVAPGSMQLPATPTNSFALYHEFTVNPFIFPGQPKWLFGTANIASRGILVSPSAQQGSSSIAINQGSTGANSAIEPWWTATTGVQATSNAVADFSYSPGTGNNPGFYLWGATDGCTSAMGVGAREPSGAILTKQTNVTQTIAVTDPGFLCSSNAAGTAGPSVNTAVIPGLGVQQTASATTCAANSPSAGQFTVTVTVPVAHGLNPGQSFTLSGYTPTGYNETYAAVAGTSGNTLVGVYSNSNGACPAAVSVEGSVGSGTAGSITITAPLTNPYNFRNPGAKLGTGITFKPGQRICGMVGEFGADSNFPGAQFAKYTDITGTDLPGSPAVSPWLNQGAVTFTGYTAAITQSAGHPALTVTAMTSYSITSASYSSGTGFVTFTMGASTPLIVGSEFTVSGMSPSGFNKTYVAVSGTSGTTIVGNPLSGPIGLPQANNPGASSGAGGSLVGVIMPGMSLAGGSAAIITPFGQWGSTGTGGVGTYGLVANPTTFSITASFATGSVGTGSSGIMTVGATPTQQIAIGTGITGASVPTNTVVVSYGTGVGGVGTYGVSTATGTISSQPNTGSGSLGSSGSPVNIYAAAGYYYSIAPGTSVGGGSLTAKNQSTLGDFMNLIGTEAANLPILINGDQGWGGAVANIGMFEGAPFPSANGVPSAAAFSQLCAKTDDFQSWASTYGGAWRSLYKLNDGGTWADHSVAEFTAHTSGSTLTIDSTQFGSTGALPTGAVISGLGLCANSVCPAISSGSGSSYTLSASVGTIASEAMSAGAYQPAQPVSSQTSQYLGFNGQISGSMLTVNSVNTSWTGTAHVAVGTTTLTIDSTTSGALAAGQCVSDGGAGGISPQYPLCITSGSGTSWTFSTSNFNYYAAGIASESMSSTIFSVIPGQYVMGAGITTPVKVTGYGTGAGLTGTYPISNPGSLTIGAEAMAMSGMGDGGAIAPGAALTVENPGVGVIYPVSALGGSTGNMQVNGEYNTGLLGGTPTNIQAQVSTTPQGPPISGCSACAWTNIANQSLSGGIWSGTVSNIPAGGPYYVSFRPLNGKSYATLPNPVSVGWNSAALGEGNAVDQLTTIRAYNNQSSFSGISQTIGFGGTTTNVQYVPGPPVSGEWSYSVPSQTSIDRFATVAQSYSPVGDGSAWVLQNASAIMGGTPTGISNMTRNGTGFQNLQYDGVTQTQTIGVGDGVTTTFSSGSGYGGSPSTSAGALASPVTATIANGSNSMSVTSIGVIPWSYLNPGQAVSCASCMAGSAYNGVITGFGTGTGSTGTYTVSPPPTAAITAQTLTITHNNLEFNGAYAFGAQIVGSVTNGVLTVNSLTAGVMAPIVMISDGANSATITACLTGCSLMGAQQAGSTWQLSSAALNGDSSVAMNVTPPGGVLYYPVQAQPPLIPVDTANGIVGTNPLIKYGAFQVLINGAVVCQDTNSFAYNVLAGNCVGAGISSAWVNYANGSYSVTFSTAPASGATIVARWTNLMSADNTLSNEQIGWVGDGTATGGVLSSVAARAGGVNAYLNGQQGPAGWPDANLTYARQLNWIFGTKFATLHNGQTNQPVLLTGQWRGEGPIGFIASPYYGQFHDLEQLDEDEVTNSQWQGTVSGSGSTGVLTLTTASTGPMWEGEAVECNPSAPTTCALPAGAELVSLASGTWGANGSTYNLTTDIGSFSNITSAIPMHNAMHYPGGGCYVGPFNDLQMQGASSGAAGTQVETGGGITGALRYGHRVGVASGACMAGNLALGSDSTLSRVTFSGCDGLATTSPCFDVGSTYAASHAATWSGSTFTITGGLSAGTRPFVPGMALSCSGCNSGLVATAVSLPPTQSTVTGAGQVGQTFTVTANGAIGGGGSGTLTGGCSGNAGTNANCIDFKFTINTTGSYGTTASLNTCGVNNLVGSNTNLPTSTGFIFPNGACVPSGVGSLVRGFRIGATQITDVPLSNASNPGPGSVYDFGPDPDPKAAVVNQNQAFTCNIVAATVVQCVLGPNHASTPAAPTLGQWASGATYASYGDPLQSTGFMGALVGYPGGQSFPFTAGSGYSNGHYVSGGVCPTLAPGSTSLPTAIPAMGYDVVGGAIVNAYPSTLGNGVQAVCTFPLSFTGTATLTGSSGTSANFKLASISGGAIAPGEVITIGGQTITIKPLVGPVVNTGTSTAQTYAVICSTTCTNVSTATAFTQGPQAGSGGAITTPPLGWSTGFTTPDGIGQFGTYDADSNLMGTLLYDNSGLAGNPLAGKFGIPSGGLEAPGLPVRPFGMRRGAAVSG